MASSDSKGQARRRRWAIGSRARTFKAFGLLLCSLILAAMVFAFNVYREIGAAHEYHLRLLDRAANDAETRIGLTLRNVSNLGSEISRQGADKTKTVGKTSVFVARGSGGSGGNRSATVQNPWRVRSDVKAISKDVSGAKVIEFAERQPYLEHRATAARKVVRPEGEGEDEEDRSAGEPCSADDVVLDASTLPPSISFGGCEGLSRISFDLDVPGLMESILPRTEFEGFLLFSQSGELLAHADSGRSGLMLRTASDLSGEGAAEALGLGELPVRRTSSQSLRVADLQIELSCQPLVVPLRLAVDGRVADRGTWTLCGAVSRSEMMHQAVTLSPGWTTVIAIVGLLGLALLPYVKPLFMARRERLTRTDLVLVATGTLLLLHLLTIAGFGFYRVLALRSVHVAHLQALADRVEDSLISDIRAHYRTLAKLDEERCGELKGEDFGDEEGIGDGVYRETLIFSPTLILQTPDEGIRLAGRLRWPCVEDPRSDTRCPEGPADPLFQSIFWVDQHGNQVHKITARDKNTAAVSVGGRGYFTHIRDGTGWPERLADSQADPQMGVDRGPNRSQAQIFVETGISVTTSRPFFALSRPSACGTDEVKVAVLTGVLPAMQPLVSPGFGFAVVGPDGEVILSSRDDLEATDDFFGLLDGGLELQAALSSRASQELKIDLGRRSHRAWLRPSLPCVELGICTLTSEDRASEDRYSEGRDSEGWGPEDWGPADGGSVESGWWIVTFYDRELTSTLFAEVLTLSVGLSLLCCILVGVLTFAVRRHLRAMIWPRRDHVSRYSWMFVLLTIYLALAVVLVVGFDSWPRVDLRLGLLGTCILTLLAAVLPLVLVRLGFLGGKAVPRSRLAAALSSRGVARPDRWLYRAMLFVFWLSLGVVPAALFFHAVWDFEVISLSRNEARWWWEEAAERSRRIDKEWEGLADERYVTARLASRSDLFPVFPFVKSGEPPPKLFAQTEHVVRPLAQMLPTYNEASSRLRHQWRGPVPRNATRDLLALRDDATAQKFAPAKGARWVLVVGLLGLMAVIWAWIQFVSQYFTLRFFRRPDPGPPLGDLVEETSHAEAGGPLGRRLVILTSNQHWSQARRLGLYEKVDLSLPPGGEPAPEPKDATAPVSVFGLAQALGDSELRAAAGLRLGVLVESRRPILIFTGSDPWTILAESAGADAGEAGGGGASDFRDARRWAGVLSEFRTEYAKIDWQAMGTEAADRSAGDHWAIWWRCSDAEKLAMLQLAEEGFLNPKQSRELEQLVRRNVLTFDDPKRPISFVDDLFCSFVRGAASSEHLLAWERTMSDSEGWHGLRYAFALFFVALFGFLFLVDQSLFDNLQAILAALAAFVPLSLGLLHRLQRPAE